MPANSRTRKPFIIITAACDGCPSNKMALNAERTQLCCVTCGAMRTPRLDEAQRRHAQRSDHPFKQSLTQKQAARLREQATLAPLPDDKRRLDLRLHDQLRDDLNAIMEAEHLTVTEIIELAVSRMRAKVAPPKNALHSGEKKIGALLPSSNKV